MRPVHKPPPKKNRGIPVDIDATDPEPIGQSGAVPFRVGSHVTDPRLRSQAYLSIAGLQKGGGSDASRYTYH